MKIKCWKFKKLDWGGSYRWAYYFQSMVYFGGAGENKSELKIESHQELPYEVGKEYDLELPK